jgi:hypothetical protein
MARNIEQVYLINPITTNNALDLMYFGQYPYGTSNDAAMTYENFIGQLVTPGLAGQIGYYATNGSLLSPANLVAGTGITIGLVGNNFTISATNSGTVTGIIGTTSQVLANGVAGVPQSGVVTLALPQNIATTSSPTFASVTTTNDSVFHTVTAGLGGGSISTNTAFGVNALAANTTGAANLAVGPNALLVNTTGSGNFAVGSATLQANIVGNNNTALGTSALTLCTASSNVAIGDTTGASITSGNTNTLVGTASGEMLTTGSTNVFVGSNTGLTTGGGVAVTTGGNNTFLGYASGANSASALGTLALGYGATATIATGATSGTNGPGIAIGSTLAPVGFRGDGATFGGGTTAGFWQPNINGTNYLMPLFVSGTLTANAFMVTNSSGIPVLSTTVPSGSAVTSITGTANQVIASASTGAVTLSLPQSIATNSAVQFNTLQLGTGVSLLDFNGNPFLAYGATASATNYLQIFNNVASGAVALKVAGSGNSSLDLYGLGTGPVRVVTSALTQPFSIFSGTSGGHQTIFQMANTIATDTVIFPDVSSFTIAGTSLALGGTNNALTASAGGIVWSDASKLNILSGTATAGLPLISGSSATPSWGAVSGTGNFALTNSPTFVTPTLGAALATSINFGGSTLSNYVASTSFTPAITVGGSSTGVTTSQAIGQYSRIGSIVHFTITIVLTSIGGLTGSVLITGLPITSASLGNQAVPLICQNVTYAAGAICAAIVGGSTSITPYLQTTATTLTALSNTQVGNTSSFYVSGSYLV